MADGEPTPRQKLTVDREAARALSEAKFEAMIDNYPTGHRTGRDRFVRTEAERLEKDIEKRHLDAIPNTDRRNRIRLGGSK